MYVNHSGCKKGYGLFSYNIFIDENRRDYELHYSDGSVSLQRSPFEEVTADWNNDGDVYAQFGAWFSDKEGGSGEFWTPENMVMSLVEAKDPEHRHYGRHLVKIPGISIPSFDKRPNLDDQIRQSENRAMHQDVERNRKMNALGIRPPGEPWAR